MATIRIKENTGIFLDSLRSQFNVSSYDDVIKILIKKALKDDGTRQWFQGIGESQDYFLASVISSSTPFSV